MIGEAKATFSSNLQRLSELSTQFSNNLLDATNDFEIIVTDVSDIEGILMQPKRIRPKMPQTRHAKQLFILKMFNKFLFRYPKIRKSLVFPKGSSVWTKRSYCR